MQIKKVLNHIKSDWEFLSSDGDIAILESHANDGRTLTLLYTGKIWNLEKRSI